MNSEPPPEGATPPGVQPEGYRPFGGYEPFAAPSPAPAGQQQRRGVTGGIVSALLAAWAFVKWGGLFLFKFAAFKTLITMVISLGLYSWAYGPVAAIGIVVMIFVHEMGHVVEIRRQGMQATAPLFIPFLGAAIFQRSHPTDALHQAEIGIAGPVAGSLAAVVALVLYVSTGLHFLALWALVGFMLNLFNLIPFGQLDGGWILAAASKWFQVAGLAMLAFATFFLHFVFGPLLLVLLVFGIPTMIARFRNDALPYYRSVPLEAKVVMGAAWIGLVLVDAFGSMQSLQVLGPLG